MKHGIAAAVCLGAAAAAGLPAERQTLAPREDTEAVLHNPDMGWVLYENYPLDARPNRAGTLNVLPQALFEGCDYVAVMFAWSDVEKEPDRFDWSRVDQACDHWLQKGKGLHLRLSTEPLFGWSHVQPPGGLGLPDWLLACIPAEQKRRRTDGPMFGWHVDARNALYRERLAIFLGEANAHFSGPRTPALVDLRGFGRWGEWHSGYPYATPDDKRAALQIVLDTWCAAFPQRMLALSYSFDPDGPAELHGGPWDKLDPAFTTNYGEYLRFSAFDLALQKTNITLRRDGAGGAVRSNERKLCEHAYRELRRALRDYALRLRLADEQGRLLAEAEAGPLPTSRWLEGDEQAITVTAAFPLMAGAAARARLLLSLHDVATGRTIKLPLSRRTHDEFCDVGEVEVLR